MTTETGVRVAQNKCGRMLYTYTIHASVGQSLQSSHRENHTVMVFEGCKLKYRREKNISNTLYIQRRKYDYNGGHEHFQRKTLLFMFVNTLETLSLLK